MFLDIGARQFVDTRRSLESIEYSLSKLLRERWLQQGLYDVHARQ